MSNPILRATSVVGLIAAASFADSLEVSLVKPEVIQARLASGKVRSSQRQATIRKLFADVGCAAEEQLVGRKTANVICTLPGETKAEIIVGGHFDFAEHGDGIVDDWSGASMLPSLYQALKNRPRHHTYVFVAFAAEERGLVGSTRFVLSTAAERRAAVRAFVNLECLGLTPVKIWTQRGSKELIARLLQVAGSLGIKLQGVNVERVGDDDSHPFLNAGIRVITIHSVTQETWRILHSTRDRLDAIHPDDYYNAYRLAAFFLAYLDTKVE